MLTMQTIEISRGEDGTPVIGPCPPVVGFSLGMLYGGTADPRWLTTEDGLVTLRGVDADGDPVEARYQATALNAARQAALAAEEGGILVCRLVA
jgi:hypothetical protein